MLPTLLRRLRAVPGLVLLLLLAAVRPAQASHLLGGEMTYQYLDANGPAATPFRYQISVISYFNPNGMVAIGATNAVAVTVDIFNRTTGAKITSLNVARTEPPGAVVLPNLPSGCAVQGPVQPFRILRYTTVVSLPVSVDGYYAVCSQTARNAGITNLANSGNTPMTLYISMTPPLIYNRAPVFTDTAVAIVCQNDTTIVLNSAVDPDGDRLIYSFGTPYGAYSGTTFPPLPASVTYNAGYSVAQPFGAGAGNFALINAATGVAKYGSTTQGQYVVAVDVREYRTINGTEVLLGTTRRDLQLLVAQCPATVSPVISPATVQPRDYTVEAGAALSFPITATQSAGHVLQMTVNSSLLDGAGGINSTFNNNPGTVVTGALTGSATATGTGTVTGTFAYTPACAEARTNPYTVSVTVQDRACGGKTVVEVFRITVVKPTGPTAIAGDDVICGVPSTRTYTASGGTAPGVTWTVTGGTIVGSATANPVTVNWTAATGGTLTAQGVSQFGCLSDGTVSKTVTVVPAPALTVTGNLTICSGSTTTITVSGSGSAYTVTGGPVTGSGAVFVLAPTATTTYTVTSNVTTGGCASTTQVTVTVNPTPAANVGPTPRSTCSGVPITLGAAPVTGNTYQWTPTTGLSSATVANPTLTLPNTTGAPITQTYTLVERAGSCSATNSVTVTVNPAETANAGAPVTICSGASAQLGAAPVAGYTYSWSPATGLSSTTVANPTVTLLNPTAAATTQTYTLTTTNTATGCFGTATVVVTVNPAVVANPGSPVTFCSGGSATLGAAPVAGFTYQWTPTTGLSSATVANPTVTLTNTTGAPITQTYTLKTTNTATTCSSTATVTVTVNPAVTANPGSAITVCSGVPGQLGAAPVAGFTYQWSPAAGLSSATVANPTVTLTNTTGAPITQTYTLTTTNTATTCSGTATVVVTVNPAVVANAGSPVTFCSGGSATLGAAPVAGFTYQWSPATGLSSTTAANPTVTLTNPTAAATTQTYTLTTTSTATGCFGTATVVVTVNPAVTANPGSAVSICSGASATLGAAPVAGFTYQWSPATGLSSATVANPTVTLTNTTAAATTQTYTLTTTNAATTCFGTATVVVTVNPAAVANAGAAQAVCDGSTITLGTAALLGYTYSWSPATNLSSATVAQPVLTGVNTTTAPITQTYTLTATTAQGCSATSSVVVTINPRPAAATIAGATSVCPTITGIAYNVVTPAAGATYTWTVTGGTIASGQGTPAITVNWGPAGNGVVSTVATNAQGCSSAPATLAVVINQVLQTVMPSGPTSVCQADGPYTYTTPAVNGSSFAWQLFGTAAGTLVSTGNSTSITFTSAGNAKLVVTQTSNPTGGICRGTSDTLRITVKPSPSAALAITGPARFCLNSGGQAYTLAGSPGSTYVFTLNGAPLANTGGVATVPASTAVGTYTLTAQETNSAGCSGPVFTRTFIVDPRPGAITINGPRFVCPATRTLTFTVPNATASSTFQWTVVNGTIASGQGTPTITVTFAAGLTANATVSVTESSQFGCAGPGASITVVPDNADAPQLTLASVVPTNNGQVTLTFRVTNAGNTPNQVQVLRRVAGSSAYAPVGTVAASATTYTDASAGLNAASSAYEYSLALINGCGDVLNASTSHTTVKLTAVAVPGFPGTPRDQGGSNLSWTAYQGFAPTSYQIYQQNDNGGYNLLNTVGGSTLQYSVANTGQGFNQCFRVVAVAADGRQSNSNTTCVEFTNSLAFYNIITPNNDGKNDKLEIQNVQLYPGNTMEIYNRWGRQVYSTTNYNNDTNYWGTDSGIAPGVYYYLFKQANGNAFKGWVEVIK